MEEVYGLLTKGVRKPKYKVAIFMCGVSGSGKSRFHNQYLKEMGLRTTHVFLNLDHVWSLTKHSQSRTILDELIAKTVDDGYSFFYEGTCRSPKYILPKMYTAKQKGYTIKLGFVYAELDLVLKRVKERVHQPASQEFVKLVYSQVLKHAKEYMNYDLFDEIYLYNNSHTSKLIFKKTKKEIHCISPDTSFYFDVSEYCK